MIAHYFRLFCTLPVFQNGRHTILVVHNYSEILVTLADTRVQLFQTNIICMGLPLQSKQNLQQCAATGIIFIKVFRYIYSGPSLKGHSVERTPL